MLKKLTLPLPDYHMRLWIKFWV